MSPSTDMDGRTLRTRARRFFVSLLTSLVFLFLDFLDASLCVLYRFLDAFIEGKPSPCYCDKNRAGERSSASGGDEESEVSESLYGRRNVFREMGMLRLVERWDLSGSAGRVVTNHRSRWSDCGCDSCVSWACSGALKLHVVVQEPLPASVQVQKAPENVIFVHGFLSSSSLWTESVFPNLSESARANYRLFAVDLLGFGRSPKPRDCAYTLKDHLGMIERSVIIPYRLNSFHLVAHSMGCIIALALAAEYTESVASITLIAPPYFPSSESNASLTALEKIAEKRLWPPLLFGSAVMSWYEHLGRCVCFLVCRNHRTWERILKLVTRRSDLHFSLIDLTRHTHHSALHTMHNVICGGMKFMDNYLEGLRKSRARIVIFHGDRDEVVPMECSDNIKMKIPHAEVDIIPNANHTRVILGREKALTRKLEHVWARFAGLGQESDRGAYIFRKSSNPASNS
ncbi:probable lysophospholipase BODYGUARD 4 isoform X2 [Rhodamnia argentea]|uniref:Probable lysophospholipase BODYGUARD 4 isoform X2 n=1 Tax=Rhodamnia argentea TaxID=178133 RepID=A0A8B8P1H8_9MYRT|nr:probable lysophospholipase BODYGUARD 4 isoform X2 [Rhodamnia argentea]